MKKITDLLLYVFYFSIIIGGIVYTQLYLEKTISKNKETISFVPQKRQLYYSTFGYKSIIADMIWLRSGSYFLTHLGGDNDYKYLSGMYNSCIDLDPNFKQVYKDTMNFLMNEPEHYKEGEAILLRGIQNLPKDWEIYYLTGFTYSYLLKEPDKAVKYLGIAQELIPRDDLHAKYLSNINILIKSNSEKKLDELGLIQYWIDRFNQTKSKTLKDYSKKNIIKYLNRSMANSLNKSLDHDQPIELIKKEHQKFIAFYRKNKMTTILKLNWKHLFIKEDANGHPWVFSKHKNKYYSYGNARANIKRKLVLFNLILWKQIESYITKTARELVMHPYDKREKLIKLKPNHKSFPTYKDIIKMGFKIKLDTPLHPYYDQKKGILKVPEYKDLDSIPESFK